MKFKRRLVKVGGYKIYTRIETAVDCGEPSDEYGRKWICKFDADHPGNMYATDPMMGYGSGANEAEAVKAFIADCFRMLDEA